MRHRVNTEVWGRQYRGAEGAQCMMFQEGRHSRSGHDEKDKGRRAEEKTGQIGQRQGGGGSQGVLKGG